VTHKCRGTANDWALEGVKESGNDSKNVEKEGIWIDDNDEWIESAQEEGWSSSSTASSIIFLDGEEENDNHPSDQLCFNMFLSKGITDWYRSITEMTASNKRPRHYSGNSRTSKWRASKDAKKNGQTMLDLFKPTVSTRRMDQSELTLPRPKKGP